MARTLFLIGIAAWHVPADPTAPGARFRHPAALEAPIRSGLEDRAPRLSEHAGVLSVDRLSVADLMVVLDLALRGRDWVVAVCLEPPGNADFALVRSTQRARSTPQGIVVRPDRADPRVAPAAALLTLHAAMLRRRRETAWRAIDATRGHAGNATAAARDLGCTHQAVSRQLRDAQLRATDGTAIALRALMMPPTPPPASALARGS